MDAPYDVAIIGGGPGGSTTGAMLKHYHPGLRVLILERETFPRDHIGESQLPPISAVLDEMGCWDKVEAAGFPIKVGATYRWGRSPELWNFEFLPLADFRDEPRPAKFQGQRKQTAFQVDRSIYDQILLDHARDLGCEVLEGTKVAQVLHAGDRVEGLRLEDGRRVEARWYVDASGNAAVLRKAMGVATDCPTKLKCIAIWDYWENAEWATHIGIGGTRIQVMSLAHGWLWFIPIGPTRTSLGFVCPAEHYKQSGRTPEALYAEAIQSDERIAGLIRTGSRRGRVESTNDWSFLSERTFGENWFLVGETAGFADPILSAGLTLTQTGARELAYTLGELLVHQEHDPAWLKANYNHIQLTRVRQHIRFADYWYACNGQFTDLQAHCAEIARDSGLDLSPEKAWAWLAQGGFANDDAGHAQIGGCNLASVKSITEFIGTGASPWLASECNVFHLDLEGAVQETLGVYDEGRVNPVGCYRRGSRRFPLTGFFALWIEVLKGEPHLERFLPSLLSGLARGRDPQHVPVMLREAFGALEALIADGWVRAELDPSRPRLRIETPKEGPMMYWAEAPATGGRG
ncbi:MAG: tryptophan 7-halogenase [Holophagaceae bacterium]